MGTGAFEQLFSELEDPRQSAKVAHLFTDILFLSSAALTKARFATAVRSHWAVENSLHWVLDVSMKEDDCQIYRGNAAEILSGARKLALNMLRAETTRKVSVPRKQKRAHGSTDYLEKVLAAGLVALNEI